MIHPKSTIQFLSSHEINKTKWDACIQNCDYGLIYARSFYLTNMTASWNALIGADYDWVFPITYKKKFGISYLYQPPLSQQLGVFAKPNVNVPFEDIVDWLKKHFSFWEINLNYSTNLTSITSPVTTTQRTNFILNLAAGYQNISINYHRDLIKNLKKSMHCQLQYRQCEDFDQLIRVYRKHYGQRFSRVKENDYQNFLKVCTTAAKTGSAIGREVIDKDGELMACVLLLADVKRLYNLMNTTTNAGRKTSANHFLFDALIREFAGSNKILDFEGSDLAGVKAFYENFGAVNQPYYFARYNNLPGPLKLFKN